MGETWDSGTFKKVKLISIRVKVISLLICHDLVVVVNMHKIVTPNDI